MKKSILATLIILTSLICHPATVNSAGYGLSVYPPLLRVNIKPGKSITQVFKVDNLTSDDKFFVARLVPFSDADLLGNPVINLQSTAPWLTYFSLANTNVKLGEPFTIRANSSEQLILGLSVPEDAPLRDLYATLLISTYSNTNEISYQGTQVSATTGSNLIITISSEAFPATLLQISDITPSSELIFKIGNYYFSDNITPISFSANVLNSGSFTAETRGLFRVSTRNNMPVYLDGIIPVNVISKTKRSLLNTDGDKLTFTPTLGNIGLHKINFAIKTDNANTENSVNLILLPFKLSLGLIFALTFILIIYRTGPSNKDQVDKH